MADATPTTEQATDGEGCFYAGPDSAAMVGSLDNGSWFSRCNCGVTACREGDYDEAVTALEQHRQQP